MKPELIAKLALAALLVLQLVWYAWLVPPLVIPIWLALLLAAGPLVMPVIGLLLRRPNAMFLAATLALLYFSHGVMEAWADPAVRELALAEVLLSVLLIGFAGWPSWRDGMARRRAKRAAQA